MFNLAPSLMMKGVMKVVIIVTTPSIGRIAFVIAPTSCPPFTTTSDNSPFADAIPSPVLSAIVLSILVLTRMPVTIKNLEANEARMRIAAGTMKSGIRDISIRAPIEIKNIAANMSRSGIVTILATDALLDSATNTPARKAPVATDKTHPWATIDYPKARARVPIKRSV